MWYEERIMKHYNAKKPKFSLCCMQGKVQLPLLRDPPETLRALMQNQDDKSNHFMKNIRSYNMMFSFTSMGKKIDKSMNDGNGPPVFKLSGQNYHMIESLLPTPGSSPKFAQLYIYDTENEVSNRMKTMRYVPF